MSDDDATVFVVTPLDTQAAIRDTIAHVGCTFDELAEMHRTGDYASVRHRMAWAAIGPYYNDPNYVGDEQ